MANRRVGTRTYDDWKPPTSPFATPDPTRMANPSVGTNPDPSGLANRSVGTSPNPTRKTNQRQFTDANASMGLGKGIGARAEWRGENSNAAALASQPSAKSNPAATTTGTVFRFDVARRSRRARRNRKTIGATDELSLAAVDEPCDVSDLHATILHLMGLDHERLTFFYKGLEERITGTRGNVVTKAIA